MARINFSKFKMISNDGKKAILRHPAGHEFHVSVKNLHPSNRAELDKLPMYKGGISHQSNPKLEESKKIPPKSQAVDNEHRLPPKPNSERAGPYGKELMAQGGQVMHYDEGGETENNPPLSDAQIARGNEETPFPSLPTATDDAQKFADQQASLPQTPDDTSATTPSTMPGTMPTADDTPGEASEPPALPSGTGPASISQTTPTTPQPTPNQPNYGGYEQQLRNATGQQLSGIAGEAKAQGEIAAAQKLASDESAKAQLEIKSHIDTATATHNAEIESVVNDIKNQHVDPNKYLSSMGTGSKIATGIGLILGGIGSGLTHGPNQALDFLNKQIDRDIEGQKMEMDKKNNLVSVYSKMLGNERDGAVMASQVMARVTADKMISAAAASGSAAAMARAQQASGALIASRLPEYMNMNLRQGAFNAINSQSSNPEDMSGPINKGKMNKLEIASKLNLPGAPSAADLQDMTKEATTLQEARATRTDFNNAYESLNKDFLAGRLSPNARNSYINSLAGRLAKASAGRYNQAEATNQIESMIPSMGDWSSTRDIKRQNNDKFFDILESGTPTLERFGVKNPTPQSRTADSRPQVIVNKSTGQKMQLVNGKYQPI